MGLAGGFDCLELELGRGLARRDALAMLFGVTSKGDHLPIPGGIQVPVFSFTPTSPPAVRASPLRGCGLIPPACARSSAPFVSIHTLLELGAQYTIETPQPLKYPRHPKTLMCSFGLKVWL